MRVVIHILGHVLTIVVSVAACIALGLLTPSARVMEVDSDMLLQRFSQNQSKLSDAQMAKQVQQYLVAMDRVLVVMAREYGGVIVDADLAIAGASDLTDEAYARALALLEQAEAS